MATILIGGGTGLVGSQLSKLLLAAGHRVLHLSRSPDLKAAIPKYHWDLKKGIIDETAIKEADYIINLAGASIAGGLWTDARKKLIIESRVNGNKLLHSAIKASPKRPKAFLSASAVGFYGNTGDQIATEESPPGKGFLTESVQAWEQSIQAISDLGMRTVTFRIGIVLSTQGGAFEKMFPSYKLYTGAYFGDGQQFYSWIHIEDLCRMFLHGIENEQLNGVYNAVGPNPARLKTIAGAIAEAKQQKALLVPIPAALLRLTMGEMSQMLLFSTRVSAEKIKATGFEFEHQELVPAISDVLKKEI